MLVINFLNWSRTFLQSAAIVHNIVVKNLLVDKKITARVKQNLFDMSCYFSVIFNICLQGVVCKVSNTGETFCFLENVVLQVTYCFLTSCWLAYNQLFWNVLIFSYYLIGQLFLSGPSNSICIGYTTTHKGFVIFTCRYFKISWNTTALSQSNCRNFSRSSISTVTLKY